MINDFKTPIKCPNCHELLTRIQVQVTKVLEWSLDKEDESVNEDRPGRFEDNGQGATEVFCHNCNKKIGYYDANTEWGLFPENTVVDF
jgi:hypothetical protein